LLLPFGLAGFEPGLSIPEALSKPLRHPAMATARIFIAWKIVKRDTLYLCGTKEL
jgi:hypothetical protein